MIALMFCVGLAVGGAIGLVVGIFVGDDRRIDREPAPLDIRPALRRSVR